MEYLIRFAQVHETFRRPEIEALASLNNLSVEFDVYSEHSPYALVRLPNDASARALIRRSISSKAIYELWGTGTTYEELHSDIKRRITTTNTTSSSGQQWASYQHDSFRFTFDTFQGSLTQADQKRLIESFRYLDLQGQIRMNDAMHTFTVFEEYDQPPQQPPLPPPSQEQQCRPPAQLKKLYFGRWIAASGRELLNKKYTLKKRSYINTTSMDAELAFLTANITLARPHTIFYDPFVGTGSFSIACAHFGAFVLGSDIDGRMIRGRKGNDDGRDGREGRDVRTNFRQYGILDYYLDCFVADLTHSPLRNGGEGHIRYLDGITCDPPYGVREGLKVLGSKDDAAAAMDAGSLNEQQGDGIGKPISAAPKAREPIIIDGVPAHLREGYVPPKRAYSLEAMLHDILSFAARTLVDDARCSLWMPTANDEDGELAIPQHPAMELVSACVQVFNKWSRRLLTYRRIPGADVAERENGAAGGGRERGGKTADDLNAFRRRYFQGFKNGGEDARQVESN